MDLNQLGPEQDPLKGPGYEVLDLVSDDESLIEGETSYSRVNGVVLQGGSLDDSEEELEAEEDGENGEWEVDSLFEDTLEEMGDEHLFDGGEPLCTTLKEEVSKK